MGKPISRGSFLKGLAVCMSGAATVTILKCASEFDPNKGFIEFAEQHPKLKTRVELLINLLNKYFPENLGLIHQNFPNSKIDKQLEKSLTWLDSISEVDKGANESGIKFTGNGATTLRFAVNEQKITRENLYPASTALGFKVRTVDGLKGNGPQMRVAFEHSDCTTEYIEGTIFGETGQELRNARKWRTVRSPEGEKILPGSEENLEPFQPAFVYAKKSTNGGWWESTIDRIRIELNPGIVDPKTPNSFTGCEIELLALQYDNDSRTAWESQTQINEQNGVHEFTPGWIEDGSL